MTDTPWNKPCYTCAAPAGARVLSSPCFPEFVKHLTNKGIIRRSRVVEDIIMKIGDWTREFELFMDNQVEGKEPRWIVQETKGELGVFVNELNGRIVCEFRSKEEAHAFVLGAQWKERGDGATEGA